VAASRTVCYIVLCIGTLEVFSLFDKDEDGAVKVTDIGAMLRSIGFNPPEAEIQRLQEEQDTDNGEKNVYISTRPLPTSA